jgi:hypothetical protein
MTTTLVISNKVYDNIAVEYISLTGGGSGQWGGRPAGGGMYLSQCDAVTVTGNSVYDNITAREQTVQNADSTSESGGMALSRLATATIFSNTITGTHWQSTQARQPARRRSILKVTTGRKATA